MLLIDGQYDCLRGLLQLISDHSRVQNRKLHDCVLLIGNCSMRDKWLPMHAIILEVVDETLLK